MECNKLSALVHFNKLSALVHFDMQLHEGEYLLNSKLKLSALRVLTNIHAVAG